MIAACWQGKADVQVQTVPDPRIVNPRDIVIRVDATTICGSDMHLYNGLVPSMMQGDIIGHEPVGEVLEVGSAVRKHAVGDRVLVSSIIGCGECFFCRRGEFSLCDNSNPNAWMMEKMYTYGTGGIFGYSHLFGGYPGAQAQYLRVPFADVIAFKVPDGVRNDQALLATDAWPTGFMGADLCNLEGGETVAVWGAGPVGLMTMTSAWLLGAGRVIAIDRESNRLEMARQFCHAETLNYEQVHVTESLRELTGGRGPDACIDACGMESHAANQLAETYDQLKQSLHLQSDRGHVVRQMIEACRKGGSIVIMGVYAGLVDKFPLGVAFSKGLRFAMGQMHGPRYIPRLLEYITSGQADPSFCITHRMRLADIPQAYDMFVNNKGQCAKILIEPNRDRAEATATP